MKRLFLACLILVFASPAFANDLNEVNIADSEEFMIYGCESDMDFPEDSLPGVRLTHLDIFVNESLDSGSVVMEVKMGDEENKKLFKNVRFTPVWSTDKKYLTADFALFEDLVEEAEEIIEMKFTFLATSKEDPESGSEEARDFILNFIQTYKDGGRTRMVVPVTCTYKFHPDW